MERTILHSDLNAFYASVEEVYVPELKAVPMAVCGDPGLRHGIILAKNELAKATGVRTAETIWSAKRKCPELTLVPPRHNAYHEYSQRVNAIYGQYTDQVEPFGIDESWLDVTGSSRLFGTGRQIADTLRERVKKELGLTLSVGVSFNKVFAKLGSDLKKPDATTEITLDNFRQIVWPLPTRELLFVGAKAAEALAAVGLTTIGHIAVAKAEALEGLLGKSGHTLWAYANGLDEEPVRRADEMPEVKSVSNNITFRRDLVGEEDLKAGLRMLCESVGERLRRQGLKCKTVQVQIKDPELKVISRQRTLEKPTALTGALYASAAAIVAASWNARRPVRMLSVAAAQLVDEQEAFFQSSLFYDEQREGRQEALERAVDAIRARHGSAKLSLAQLMASDLTHAPEEPSDS